MSSFDEVINRHNTDSIKYDFAEKWGKPKDVLPLWVADMDFRAPDQILKAMTEKSEYGIFGYSESRDDYFEVLRSWFERRHGWQIKPEWLVKTPGVVNAICTSVRAFTEKGDSVIIQQPVYYPFENAVTSNGRKLVVSELKYSEGKYTIDFEDFENKIISNQAKLFILCNPHNPVGRVWTREELERLGDICVRHSVIIVSDEIHEDFVYPGHRHSILASLKPEYSQLTVTCTAPSKTFNIAGLQVSNVFIENSELMQKFRDEMSGSGILGVNIMGITASKAAYRYGDVWLEELKNYLQKNLGFLREFLNERLPQIRLVEPEGTYLVWLDFRKLGMDDKKLNELIIKKAGLWLDEGTMFGKGGEGFQRVNIACPSSVLENALSKLESAISSAKHLDASGAEKHAQSMPSYQTIEGSTV